MPYSVVLQLGYTIYGTGETADAARQDAATWLANGREDLAHLVDLNHAHDGDLVLLPCTGRLHDDVQAYGGDRRFTIVDGIAMLLEEDAHDA